MPPSSICRGCANQLSTCNAGVDIFGRDAFSNLNKNHCNIKRGIELITGLTVSDADGLPRRLCAECKNKLEEFLAFREQLLTSLRVFLGSGNTSEKSEQSSEAVRSLASLGNMENSPIDKPVNELNQEVKIEVGISDENERSKELLNRINLIDEDAESDIDVCSGEDDGVLELDFQSRKDVIYEIGSSDESDIQVCDLEPSGL